MKLPYFKLKEAFNEARDSFSYGSAGDKLAATAKLLGKSVANAGMAAVEIGSEAIKRVPEVAGDHAEKHLNEKRHLMTEEQVSRAQELIEKGNRAKENRLAEREEREKEERERR